ncbi:hypothetical protein EUTSA_v10020544mg [Eutrema salsugineum]|uniref:C2H2-type domain-containing protein n=2 Tax=Eutrema salsugineum TaxID=72664 RepID=V4LDU4_EUTSA|nr:hypothetical protein EUTSA_v10020544mg [Eutrema salsugineum]ESQ48616.1 hypothetical protein EUTSA_v10020544mg [Eutrema salsugineum]
MNKDMLLHQQVQQQEENMSNLTSASGDQASVSSGNRTEASGSNYFPHQQQQLEQQQQFFVPESQPQKKRRNQPGNPDPESEVIALSPKTLMATNRFVCEICNKGFQRDQNLQLHRRGHNLPWKLKQRSNKEVIRKKVYICPEESCVHHDPSRALGDLTGIKKHFCRKHGEKKWKCDKCSKKYAVQSDCKAHSKTCGTKEYRCDCGTLFSRRDSFITHRAFCEALAEETAREVVIPQNQNHQPNPLLIHQPSSHHHQTQPNMNVSSPSSSSHNIINSLHFGTNNGTSNINSSSNHLHTFPVKKEQQQSNDHIINYHHHSIPPWLAPQPQDLISSNPNPSNGGGGGGGLFSLAASPAMSATALLQKAAQMGSTKTPPLPPTIEFERSAHHNNLTTTMAAMMTSPSGFISSNNNNQVLFQDYNASGFDHNGGEEAFDDTFGGFLRTNAATTASAAGSDQNKSGGGGEGLTRDFLGLRPLMSHNEILSFAGLGNCINGPASDQLHPKPWQG